MDMQQVEAFLAVADELHFGRAADRVVLSRPRVSRLIASLEREIGGTLFDRTSRRVRLTPLGPGSATSCAPATPSCRPPWPAPGPRRTGHRGPCASGSR
jgi:DNA-binding transcriptional LysR family regulator